MRDARLGNILVAWSSMWCIEWRSPMIVITEVSVLLIDCIYGGGVVIVCLYARHMLAATVTVELCMQCIHQGASASAYASYFYSSISTLSTCFILNFNFLYFFIFFQPKKSSQSGAIPLFYHPLCEHATRISACTIWFDPVSPKKVPFPTPQQKNQEFPLKSVFQIIFISTSSPLLIYKVLNPSITIVILHSY